MHIMLTVCSGLILCACIYVLLRAQAEADTAATFARTGEHAATKLQGERARVTVCEREIDALRRELRKLSGKFHATQREGPTTCDHHDRDGNGRCLWCGHQRVDTAAPCENWTTAQREGPSSKAATCECLFCMTQRADRARARRELVPKGAQATAATAKLNSGQP